MPHVIDILALLCLLSFSITGAKKNFLYTVFSLIVWATCLIALVVYSYDLVAFLVSIVTFLPFNYVHMGVVVLSICLAYFLENLLKFLSFPLAWLSLPKLIAGFIGGFLGLLKGFSILFIVILFLTSYDLQWLNQSKLGLYFRVYFKNYLAFKPSDTKKDPKDILKKVKKALESDDITSIRKLLDKKENH